MDGMAPTGTPGRDDTRDLGATMIASWGSLTKPQRADLLEVADGTFERKVDGRGQIVRGLTMKGLVETAYPPSVGPVTLTPEGQALADSVCRHCGRGPIVADRNA